MPRDRIPEPARSTRKKPLLHYGVVFHQVGRVSAAEIEAMVIDQLRSVFRQPEIVAGTWRAARAEQDDTTEAEVGRRSPSSTRCGTSFSPPNRRGSCICWSSGGDVRIHGIEVRLRPTGLAGLVREDAADLPIRALKIGQDGLHKQINLGTRASDREFDYVSGFFDLVRSIKP